MSLLILGKDVCLGVLDLCKLLQSVYVGNVEQPLNTLLDGFG